MSQKHPVLFFLFVSAWYLVNTAVIPGRLMIIFAIICDLLSSVMSWCNLIGWNPHVKANTLRHKRNISCKCQAVNHQSVGLMISACTTASPCWREKSFQASEQLYSPFISCQTLQTCSNSWSFCVSATGYVSTDGANGIVEINGFVSIYLKHHLPSTWLFNISLCSASVLLFFSGAWPSPLHPRDVTLFFMAEKIYISICMKEQINKICDYN